MCCSFTASDLFIKPENIAVPVGSSVTMNCSFFGENRRFHNKTWHRSFGNLQTLVANSSGIYQSSCLVTYKAFKISTQIYDIMLLLEPRYRYLS